MFTSARTRVNTKTSPVNLNSWQQSDISHVSLRQRSSLSINSKHYSSILASSRPLHWQQRPPKMANISCTLLTNLIYDAIPARAQIPQPVTFTQNGSRAMPYCRPTIRTKLMETLYSNPSKSLAELALDDSLEALTEPGFHSMHNIPLDSMLAIVGLTRRKLCESPADCCGACISDAVAVYFETHPENFRDQLDMSCDRRRIFFHLLAQGFDDQKYQQPSPYPISTENFASDFWWSILEDDVGMVRFKLDKMAIRRSNLQAKAVLLYNEDSRYVNWVGDVTTTPKQQSLWAIHLKHHPTIVPLVRLNDYLPLHWEKDFLGWWLHSGRLHELLDPRRDELRGGPAPSNADGAVVLSRTTTRTPGRRRRKKSGRGVDESVVKNE